MKKIFCIICLIAVLFMLSGCQKEAASRQDDYNDPFHEKIIHETVISETVLSETIIN